MAMATASSGPVVFGASVSKTTCIACSSCLPSPCASLSFGSSVCLSRQRNWEGAVLSFRRRGGRRRCEGGRCFALRAQGGGQYKDGDNESKQVLDSFFLGKAFAEAVNERVGSALGELLSDIGRRQAEQEKRIRQFQEEVQERAKVAALKAARKAMGIETQKSQPSRTSTTSSSAGSNGLPSLPYEDLPPLGAPAQQTPSKEQDIPEV